MGFEQLAALKTQLAEKARQEKLAKQGGGGNGRGPRPTKAPVAKSDTNAEVKTELRRDGAPSANARPAGNKPAGGKPTQKHAGGKPAHQKTDRGPRPERQDHGARPDRQERAGRGPRENAAPTDPVLLLIRKLQNRFAATFPKKPAPKVPLKIGVFEDLLVHAAEFGADEAQLRAAIKTWCGGSRYWACMVEGAARIDLAGQPAGLVTAADANRARRLEGHREKRAQQRATASTPAQGAVAATAADADAAASAALAKAEVTASASAAPANVESTVSESAAPASADATTSASSPASADATNVDASVLQTEPVPDSR